MNYHFDTYAYKYWLLVLIIYHLMENTLDSPKMMILGINSNDLTEVYFTSRQLGVKKYPLTLLVPVLKG